MKLKLLFALLIITTSNAQTQIGQDIVDTNREIYALALSENGNVLAVSGTDYNYNPITQVFSNVSGNWTQVGQDLELGKTLLSNDGSILAIFDLYQGGGLARVYKNMNNNWVQIGQDILEPLISDYKIALSGDGSVLAIAPNIGPYPWNIYKNISGTWTVTGTITNVVGSSICLSEDGNTLAAIYAPSNVINIFKYVNNNWIQSTPINLSSNYMSNGGRMAMSSDGNTIAVSTANTKPMNVNSVNVFRYTNNTWAQMGTSIISSKEALGEVYGYGEVVMSGSGNVVALGAWNGQTWASGVDIFEYLQGNWVKKGEIIDTTSTNSIHEVIAISRDGSSLALRKNEDLGQKTASGVNTSNHQGKSPTGGVRVFDISGILSSDTFVLENFKIYPNPATDILNIELENSLVLEKVLIYNTTGQLVKETSEKTINVSGFAKGIYNVQVLTNHGKATKKVIVK